MHLNFFFNEIYSPPLLIFTSPEILILIYILNHLNFVLTPLFSSSSSSLSSFLPESPPAIIVPFSSSSSSSSPNTSAMASPPLPPPQPSLTRFLNCNLLQFMIALRARVLVAVLRRGDCDVEKFPGEGGGAEAGAEGWAAKRERRSSTEQPVRTRAERSKRMVYRLQRTKKAGCEN